MWTRLARNRNRKKDGEEKNGEKPLHTDKNDRNCGLLESHPLSALVSQTHNQINKLSIEQIPTPFHVMPCHTYTLTGEKRFYVFTHKMNTNNSSILHWFRGKLPVSHRRTDVNIPYEIYSNHLLLMYFYLTLQWPMDKQSVHQPELCEWVFLPLTLRHT